MQNDTANRTVRYIWYLITGDLVCFYLALYLAIVIRSLGLPDTDYLALHFLPFTIIFLVWILVMYITGLYDLRSFVFREQLARLLINAQLVNSGIVILVFYFIPAFLIAPKTTLILDLILTLVLLFAWRSLYVRSAGSQEHERAIIVGSGTVADELRSILKRVPYFGLTIVEKNPSVVVIDLNDPSTETMHADFIKELFSGVRFVDMQHLYEEITGRVPLPLISDRWVLENISLQPKPIYTVLKRLMDVLISLPLLLLSLVLYPIIAIFQKSESPGPLLYVAERVGEKNKNVRFYKFRTMTGVDFDKPGLRTEHKVTKVGNFLRKSRLDEVPQLWNVLKGDMSLIGPRPEFPALVNHYSEQVPFYRLRHVVKPGLSGWAQVNDYNVPRETADVELTRNKLSYDLYYVKNRSFILDLKIVLKTINTLISRVGS